ncbi:hypothetical protein KSP40_PGU018874 [Platanthera guangdongensis]|uniref:Uncharacterized protein n=1 Tax=Platanthera guangdongensis TaxID=2320717 RepID=A0ABR2MGW2_9ASPA
MACRPTNRQNEGKIPIKKNKGKSQVLRSENRFCEFQKRVGENQTIQQVVMEVCKVLTYSRRALETISSNMLGEDSDLSERLYLPYQINNQAMGELI